MGVDHEPFYFKTWWEGLASQTTPNGSLTGGTQGKEWVARCAGVQGAHRERCTSSLRATMTEPSEATCVPTALSCGKKLAGVEGLDSNLAWLWPHFAPRVQPPR